MTSRLAAALLLGVLGLAAPAMAGERAPRAEAWVPSVSLDRLHSIETGSDGEVYLAIPYDADDEWGGDARLADLVAVEGDTEANAGVGDLPYDASDDWSGDQWLDDLVPPEAEEETTGGASYALVARDLRAKDLATLAEDRGIDNADTKWRRQARLQGVRMRCLNGPEFAYAGDGYNTTDERGWRHYAGAVVPLNSRWELAALDKLGSFNPKAGGKAGLEALTFRVGANPSVSFRPWVAVTPYTGLWDADGVGLGLAAGIEKNWDNGISLLGRAYAWEPWDEGYDTAVQDGRRHGFQIQGTLPVDRRLTLSGGFGYEWLELGPHALAGSQYAGRRGNWNLRAEWLLLRRDDAFMGYGFREPTLWSEDLIPVEFGVFAEIGGERYIRPRGFTALNPTEKSLSERVGFLYNQAISPHLGFNLEGYVGQDPRRGIRAGDLYGMTFRLNAVVNTGFRLWVGWGYTSEDTTMEGAGGPSRNFSFGFNGNF